MKKLILMIIAAVFLCFSSNVVHARLSKEESAPEKVVFKTYRVAKLTSDEKKAIKKTFEFLEGIYEEKVDGDFFVAKIDGGYHVKFQNLITISSDGEEDKVNDGFGEVLYNELFHIEKSVIGP